LTERLQRAVQLGTRVGWWITGVAVINAILKGSGSGLPIMERMAFIILIPIVSFALAFGLVFALAYAFPPSSDALSGRLTFPGAGWVVWPLVGLLVAGTVYLVVTRP